MSSHTGANGSDLAKPTILFERTDGEAYGGMPMQGRIGFKTVDGKKVPFAELEIGDKPAPGETGAYTKYSVVDGSPIQVEVDTPASSRRTTWDLAPTSQANPLLSVGEAQFIANTFHTHKDEIEQRLRDVSDQVGSFDLSALEKFLQKAFDSSVRIVARGL